MSEVWIKLHTRTLWSSDLCTLPMALRGVWALLLLVSKQHSAAPGYFVHDDDRPMTADEIVHEMHCLGPPDEKLIRAAMNRFVQLGLLRHSPIHGYAIVGWRKWQVPSCCEDARLTRAREQRQRRMGIPNAPAKLAVVKKRPPK